MTLDSATVLARTAAGEAELLTPSNGLALGQRRLLTQLQDPRAFDELVAEHALDAAKAARDLTRLAQLGLVVVLVPAAANAAAYSAGESERSEPVAPGAGTNPLGRWPLLVGAAAMLAVALAWLSKR